jgi:hypothetical protein
MSTAAGTCYQSIPLPPVHALTPLCSLSDLKAALALSPEDASMLQAVARVEVGLRRSNSFLRAVSTHFATIGIDFRSFD